MTKKIILLGSTGSIGESTLNAISKKKTKFKIKLLTTNRNVKKIYKQAVKYNVKKIVINDKNLFYKYKSIFDKKKIKVFFNLKDFLIRNKIKVDFVVSAISGLDGLEPTIKIIKHTKNLCMANKESIICGWMLIDKELKKNETNFIPIDSEHFSVWNLIKNENKKNIKKIYLTASGGPFLKRKLKNIENIKPKIALKHPNWKMGKKISIDSATMMNKIFEVIEARKIFNMKSEDFKILIHPKSYIHAIVHFKTGLTKFLAHNTTMEIPIINSLYSKQELLTYENQDFNYKKLNGLNFITPDIKNFPLLKILNYKHNNTYFEIILVTANDILVKMYLENFIKYIDIHKQLIKVLKNPYFVKYYKESPKNINEIRNMVKKVEIFFNKKLK